MLSLHRCRGSRRLLFRLTLPAGRAECSRQSGELCLIAGLQPPYLRRLRLYRSPAPRPDELPPAA